MFLLVLAVVSVHLVNGQHLPQYYPYAYSAHDDLHNAITGLTYDLHNRIAAQTHNAIHHTIGNSINSFAFADSGPGVRYPSNGNFIVRPFYLPGQHGIFVSATSTGSVRPSSSPVRPSSSPVRPSSSPVRPLTTPGRPVTSSIRPTNSPIRPVSTPLRPGRPFAATSVGSLPGGGVSASAVAVSTSG